MTTLSPPHGRDRIIPEERTVIRNGRLHGDHTSTKNCTHTDLTLTELRMIRFRFTLPSHYHNHTVFAEGTGIFRENSVITPTSSHVEETEPFHDEISHSLASVHGEFTEESHRHTTTPHRTTHHLLHRKLTEGHCSPPPPTIVRPPPPRLISRYLGSSP